MTTSSTTRRAFLATGAMALTAPAAMAAGFNWKRYDGTRLHFMVSTHPWTAWAQKQLGDLERDTGIKVTWEILYEDQLRQKLPLLLRSDPGSVDGFFTLPSWDAAAFWKAGWYEPLGKYINSDLTAPGWDFADFFPNVLNIHKIHAVQIGVPINIECQGLFFNKAMLSAKRLMPPRTLDEMMTVAKAVTNRSADVAGYVTRGDGVQAVYTIAPYLFAFGGRWLDEKGRPELAGKPFVEALRFYGDILRAAGPPNIVGMQWKSTYPLFEQAKAAMFTDATNFLAYFKDPSESTVVNDVDVVPLPAGPAGSHSTLIAWGLAIAASSRNMQAAWYAIQYLTSKQMMMKSTAAAHMPPSRQSVYDSKMYTQSVPADMISTMKAEIPDAVPNGANPLVIPVAQVRSAIGEAIVGVLQGGDPEKLANQAQKRVVGILAG